jgi:hypothetical protein
LLFVAMPFATKRDPSGRIAIDFDDVYEERIKLAAQRRSDLRGRGARRRDHSQADVPAALVGGDRGRRSAHR